MWASAVKGQAITLILPYGLVEKGIESISLNPDSVIATWQALARNKS